MPFSRMETFNVSVVTFLYPIIGRQILHAFFNSLVRIQYRHIFWTYQPENHFLNGCCIINAYLMIAKTVKSGIIVYQYQYHIIQL